MADSSSVAETAPAPAPAPAVDIGTKVNRAIEALKTKNLKLAEDNKKLKEALLVAKSSGSRIRRIPKKAKTAAAGTVTEEEEPKAE